MAGRIYDWPVTADGDPELCPWALTGTTLEPALAQENVGWQAYGVGPPPDYRLENYARNRQWRLNQRDLAAPLFVEYPEGTVQVAGVAAGANQRRITINGTNTDYTDQAGDTLLMVCQAFATLINSDPVLRIVVYAEANTAVPGLIDITSRTPGQTFTLAVAVLAGAGTIVVLTAVTTPIVRAPGGAVSPTQFDHVIGSTSTEDTGNPVEDARIVWDKSKGAFRVGRVTAAQWDDASRGAESTALGLDCTAAGAQALAAGNGSSAAGARGIAIGNGSAASGADAIAIGDTNTANTDNAIAIGAGCTASGVGALAAGAGATATAQQAVALGMGNATGVGAVAIGGSGFATADAVDDGDIAIGESASADSNGGARPCAAIGDSAAAVNEDTIAVGNSAAASVAEAVAVGHSSVASATAATAIGANSTASAARAFAGPHATASAADATAFGDNCIASGAASTAIGTGALASGAGAVAMGKRAGINGEPTASGDGAVAFGAPTVDSNIYDSLASGDHSFAHGDSVEASADHARATGNGAVAANRGEIAHASLGVEVVGPSYEQQRHQIGTLVAQARTTDATETTLCPDVLDGTSTTWTPKDDRAYRVRVTVVAKDEASADCKAWAAEFLLGKDAGAFAINGIAFGANMPVVGTLGAGFAAAVAQIEDSGGGAINVRGTGAVGLDARWTCRIEYDQVGIDY